MPTPLSGQNSKKLEIKREWGVELPGMLQTAKAVFFIAGQI